MPAPGPRAPALPLPLLRALRALPHQRPREGRDYWVLDDALPDPLAVRARLLASEGWVHGAPVRKEAWPGMRAMPALLPGELEPLERWVMARTGVKKLRYGVAPEGDVLNHNCVQAVGARDSGPRPHTDRKTLCTYAGVLYLCPTAPASCGTSFYRVRLPDGTLGGNRVPDPHDNLVEALGTRQVPAGLFVEELRVEHRFNRLLVYPASVIHSASAYCGDTLATRRMTALFFWRR